MIYLIVHRGAARRYDMHTIFTDKGLLVDDRSIPQQQLPARQHFRHFSLGRAGSLSQIRL